MSSFIGSPGIIRFVEEIAGAGALAARYLILRKVGMAAERWLEKAKECARLAEAAADPLEARLYRALERDFLDKAKRELGEPDEKAG
jgi:hypothetical protein